jgi:hypothetical protein
MPLTAEHAVEKAVVTAEERFLFDLQGFLLLPGVLSESDCEHFRARVKHYEDSAPDDAALRERNNRTGKPCQPTLELQSSLKRLNGLLRLDSAFDALIAHPKVAPYLEAFIDGPQLVNTWSISKFKGEEGRGGWHRGVQPFHYSCRNGRIRTIMLNVIWFLTDNGPEDGCLVALPGGHKSNLDLEWGKYRSTNLPGARRIIGKAGDVFMFSETVLHTGVPKTTGGCRTNLYFNYTARDYNVMTYTPEHNYHFCMPPGIRARFDEKQRQFTQWMEYANSTEQER